MMEGQSGSHIDEVKEELAISAGAGMTVADEAIEAIEAISNPLHSVPVAGTPLLTPPSVDSPGWFLGVMVRIMPGKSCNIISNS